MARRRVGYWLLTAITSSCAPRGADPPRTLPKASGVTTASATDQASLTPSERALQRVRQLVNTALWKDAAAHFELAELQQESINAEHEALTRNLELLEEPLVALGYNPLSWPEARDCLVTRGAEQHARALAPVLVEVRDSPKARASLAADAKRHWPLLDGATIVVLECPAVSDPETAAQRHWGVTCSAEDASPQCVVANHHFTQRLRAGFVAMLAVNAEQQVVASKIRAYPFNVDAIDEPDPSWTFRQDTACATASTSGATHEGETSSASATEASTQTPRPDLGLDIFVDSPTPGARLVDGSNSYPLPQTLHAQGWLCLRVSSPNHPPTEIRRRVKQDAAWVVRPLSDPGIEVIPQLSGLAHELPSPSATKDSTSPSKALPEGTPAVAPPAELERQRVRTSPAHKDLQLGTLQLGPELVRAERLAFGDTRPIGQRVLVAQMDDEVGATGWHYADLRTRQVLAQLDGWWGASRAAGFGSGRQSDAPVLLTLAGARVHRPFDSFEERFIDEAIWVNHDSTPAWIFGRDRVGSVWAGRWNAREPAAVPKMLPFPFWPRRLGSTYGDLQVMPREVTSHERPPCGRVGLEGATPQCQAQEVQIIGEGWGVLDEGRHDTLLRRASAAQPASTQDLSSVCTGAQLDAYLPSPPRAVFSCSGDSDWLLWSPERLWKLPKAQHYSSNSRLEDPIFPLSRSYGDDMIHWLDVERARHVTSVPVQVVNYQTSFGLSRQTLVRQKDKPGYWLLDFDTLELTQVMDDAHCPSGMDVLDAQGSLFALSCYHPASECESCIAWGGLLDTKSRRLLTHSAVYSIQLVGPGLAAALVADENGTSLRPISGW